MQRVIHCLVLLGYKGRGRAEWEVRVIEVRSGQEFRLRIGSVMVKEILF